jgi:hypothetical protein
METADLVTDHEFVLIIINYDSYHITFIPSTSFKHSSTQHCRQAQGRV